MILDHRHFLTENKDIISFLRSIFYFTVVDNLSVQKIKTKPNFTQKSTKITPKIK